MARMSLKELLLLLRVKHYVKNLFILAPIVFSFHYTLDEITKAFIAFISFCFLSSSVYIINDIFDIELDKKHPRKRKRPIASGKVSVPAALCISICLLIIGVAISLSIKITLSLLSIAYFTNSLVYSIVFKHVSILDIFSISGNFVIRLLAGGVATNIELSRWIIIVTFLLAIFLSIAKRKEDMLLHQEGIRVRKVIEQYSNKSLDFIEIISASLVVIVYILYTIFPNVTKPQTNHLYITSIFVIFGIFRYILISENRKIFDPVEVLFHDKIMAINIILWILTYLLLAN